MLDIILTPDIHESIQLILETANKMVEKAHASESKPGKYEFEVPTGHEHNEFEF